MLGMSRRWWPCRLLSMRALLRADCVRHWPHSPATAVLTPMPSAYRLVAASPDLQSLASTPQPYAQEQAETPWLSCRVGCNA